MTRLRAWWIVAAAVAGAVLLAGCQTSTVAASSARSPATSAAAAAAATNSKVVAAAAPTAYLLSLGDSLAFGYQQAKLDAEQHGGHYDPATFPGYTTPLARRLAAATGARVAAVDYGCPGETTTTYLDGGCPFGQRLHNPYAGAQASAALTFLRAHRGHVPLVTLSLGANDLLGLEFGCGFRLACLQSRLAATTTQVTARVAGAIRQLHRADPHARIVVLALYNPLGSLVPATNPLLLRFDAALSAAVRGAGGRVADAYPAFNRAAPQPATLCRLTAFCVPGQDVHPTDAGYAVLAGLFWRAAGIGR